MNLSLTLLIIGLLLTINISNGFLNEELQEEAEKETKGFLDFLFTDRDCNCRCGIPNRQAKLLGGDYLRTFEFPWLALLQVREQVSIQGTLINDRYILTSTSQLVGLTPYDVKVTLGQYDRCFPDVTSQNLSVSNLLLHPDFSPGNRAHDIALVRLSAPVKFEKRIRPVCLSFPGFSYTGQVATVVGWNEVLEEEGQASASCRPRKAGLPVLSREDCVATAVDSQYVSDDKGCIGVVGTKSIVCPTDSGGPVMYKTQGGSYLLIGILSDRNNCGETPSSALYTKVNDHLEWIKSKTRDACYCIKTDPYL